MFTTIADFVSEYSEDFTGGQKIFGALTDESLDQRIADGHRTLGQIAWHVIQTGPEMLGEVGLKIDSDVLGRPVPHSAAEIAAAYRTVGEKVIDAVRSQWTDDDLQIIDPIYGTEWKRGKTLLCLLAHEAHHRGQMSVLMRQAGVPVHGVYGPAKEEWVLMGMEAPV
jgi:uncharacterized damage-inducible protein DinB